MSGGKHDSPRWCALHESWGDHHTARCPGFCGDTYDHTVEITHEDDCIVQWRCSGCGAEGDYDPQGES